MSQRENYVVGEVLLRKDATYHILKKGKSGFRCALATLLLLPVYSRLCEKGARR